MPNAPRHTRKKLPKTILLRNDDVSKLPELYFVMDAGSSQEAEGSLWVKRSLGCAEGPAPTGPAPTTTIKLEPQFIEAVKTYQWELAEKLVSSEQDRQDLANSRARVAWMAKHISDGDVQRAKSLAITEAEVERIDLQAVRSKAVASGSHGEQEGGPHSGVSPELRRRVLELDRVSDALVEAKMTVAQYALELEEARQQFKALKGRTTSAKAEEELEHVRAALAKAEAAYGEAHAGRINAEVECERLRAALAAAPTNAAAATARAVAAGPRVALTASPSAPSLAISNLKGVRVESPLHHPIHKGLSFHKGLSYQLTEVHDYHYIGFATSNIAAPNGGNYTVTLGGASYHGTLRAKNFETRGHLSPRMRFESGKAVTRRQPLKPQLSKPPREPARSSRPPVCDAKVADADVAAGNAAAGSDATAAGTSGAVVGACGAVLSQARQSGAVVGTSGLVGSQAPLIPRQLATPRLLGEPKPPEPPEPSAWSAFEAMLAQDGAQSFAFVYPLPCMFDEPRVLDEPQVLDEPASPADDESPILADGVPAVGGQGSRSDADALLLFGGFCVWDASGNILKVHALTDEQPLATALEQPLEAGVDAPVAGRAPGSSILGTPGFPILGTPRLHFNRSEDKDERGQPLLPQALRQYLYEIHRVIAC